jgi:hypothetical protein
VDLKLLSQYLHIRDASLRRARALISLKPADVVEETSTAITLAAVLFEHGFEGDAVREFLNRSRVQLEQGKTQLQVDYRGDFPVTVRLDASNLVRRLAAFRAKQEK